MIINAIKSRLVRAGEISLNDLLMESLANFAKKSSRKTRDNLAKNSQFDSQNLDQNSVNLIREILPENSVIAISSKIVALCENSVVAKSEIDKYALIKSEADFYTEDNFSPWGYHFVRFRNGFLPGAGIDESNAGGDVFVLSPRDPMKTAEQIREFLSIKFSRKFLGVIITDSTMLPTRRGAIGIALGWSGFHPVKNSVGKKDLFGREFKFETQSIVGGLAAAANLPMGEATEQSPFAIISDADFVEFTGVAPSADDIRENVIEFDVDLYYPFFSLAKWQKGGGGYKK